MTPLLRARRTSALLAGTALAASALVLTGAGPASAVPVEGTVSAYADGQTSPGCALVGDSSESVATFTNKTGGKTAHVTEPYSASQSGTVGASGSIDLETTASGSVRDRAFRRVDFESTGVVLVNNASDLACGLELTGRSEAAATLKVRKRGKIQLSWSSSVGDLASVKVTGPSGVLLSRDPSQPDGGATLRVRPGTYQLQSQFVVGATEAETAVGSSTTRVGFYTLKATFAAAS